MKFGFYPKLAIDGIRKNKRLYLPYILACIGMVMITYIMSYLSYADSIAKLPGGNYLQIFMNLGTYVIVFFGVLFLFYTNSFLNRRRKKEFGLYNILGMNRKNLSKIIACESFLVTVISLICGLTLGIALSKLFELGFANLLKGEITYEFSIPISAIIVTIIPFLIIFTLIFLNSLRQVWFSKTISLIRSENIGEKPPKANWFIGLLGVIVLVSAYYISVTIKNPLSALEMFFIAVIMVIIGTYMLLIAGSVVFCRILQKNKSYYYKKNHFVSVSSMVYRMKRNGAGLASICVLATMVLVMISSTSALIIGSEDVIKTRYPYEMNVYFQMNENKDITDEDIEMFRTVTDSVLEENDTETLNTINFYTATISGILKGGEVVFDRNDVSDLNIGTLNDLIQIYIVPIEDYNRMMNTNAVLNSDEVLIYSSEDKFSSDTFRFKEKKQYKVKEILTDCFKSPDVAMSIVESIILIVPDVSEIADELVNSVGTNLVYKKWYYSFDTNLSADKNIELYNEIKTSLLNLQNGHDTFSFHVECRDFERKDFYALYGGLFYLGIILSIVFILAAVLIIYYKQISEGYEDQSRFEIMQKVGMTKKDIRRSINSQLLTIFFLPLVTAGLHLAFAFPIIEKLLMCLNLKNHPLFIGTTIGSFLIFALFYAIVYRITSNAYYNIVSGAKGRE